MPEFDTSADMVDNYYVYEDETSLSIEDLSSGDDTQDLVYPGVVLNDTAFLDSGFFIEKIGHQNLCLGYNDETGVIHLKLQVYEINKNMDALEAMIQIMKRPNLAIVGFDYLKETVFKVEETSLELNMFTLTARSMSQDEIDEITTKL